MSPFLLSSVTGPLSALLLGLNTVLWSIPLFAVTFLKLIIPLGFWRKICSRMLTAVANGWIWINSLNMTTIQRVRLDVTGVEGLDPNKWYLVLCNHQSWTDILVLQKVFFRKIPFLKFFVKKELIWFPVMGQVWWALDMPFMKRYSAAFLEKHPHLKGKDLEATRKACEKFKTIPISIMIFVEGTRFTDAKHRKQGSPFKHLLKPRAGGIAFVLAVLGDRLNDILNVTIVYPGVPKSFWAFLSGKIREVKVKVESLPVPKEFLGDYLQDTEYRERFQQWVNALWEEKDRTMEEMAAVV
ncbi:MAG: acyltransferase [Deltaproteobacteria bacterium]|nr:acyltransferase [Deltaproteobacteria bacterium]